MRVLRRSGSFSSHGTVTDERVLRRGGMLLVSACKIKRFSVAASRDSFRLVRSLGSRAC